MTRATAVSILAALLTAMSAGAGEIPLLTHTDPLEPPPPELDEPLRMVFQAMRPAEKIVSLLEERLSKAGPADTISTIVLLHEPYLEERAFGDAREADEARRLQVAALAHEFVDAAGAVGFQPTGALSHFPIVFGEVAAEDVPRLAALSHVRAIQEDLEFRLFRAEGGNLIRAHQFRDQLGATGEGVGVAVLDSGIAFDHPELAGKIAAHADLTGTTGDGNDDHGHGTAVAGIIAGENGGVAPGAHLWAIKVLTSEGVTTSSSLLAGLEAVYANRHDFGGVHVINMSLGGLLPGFTGDFCDSAFPAEAGVLQDLVEAGVTPFAATGNDGNALGVGFPACLSYSIAVGSVYDANVGPKNHVPPGCFDPGTAADMITCYSNSGVSLDVLAPSTCASTTEMGGGVSSCLSGTSFASPYAAGVAAQLLSLRPQTSPLEILLAMRLTGRLRTDPRNGITRPRIDAIEAYELLLAGGGGETECVPSSTVMCLNNDRFQVELAWQTAQGDTGLAQVVPVGSADSGLFWFFDPDNWELLVKVLNGCGVNNHYWVFAAATTDVGYTLRATDTASGLTREYTNPVGVASPAITDSTAFATCP